MDEYYRAIRLLPSWLAGPLGQLPAQTAAQIHELRFRTGCGVFVTLSGRQLPLQDLPECPLQLRECVLDQFQIEEIFHTLCGGAVHAHQTELAHGFLTTPSGCRVGVAGRYVDRDGQTVLQQMQGLNLRIARAVPVQLPDELLVQLKKHFIGMLLVGEPDSGKTTLLRQIARELAGMQRRACVVDERCEIFPPGDSEKMPPLDILLDELGTLAETAALEQGFYSGVDFVASVHAASVEEAARRPQVQALQRHGMLRVFVLLHGCTAPGKVRQVCTV